MPDIDSFEYDDETPEADVVQQHLPVDPEDETGLDTTHLDTIGDRDANEADVIDQATIVPDPHDELPPA